MLEPDKEGLAYQRLVRAGAMTIPQMLRELGYDPDAHLAEIAETNKKLDELGIVLDSDPRKTNTSGGMQGAGAAKGDKPAEPPSEDAPSSDRANARLMSARAASILANDLKLDLDEEQVRKLVGLPRPREGALVARGAKPEAMAALVHANRRGQGAADVKREHLGK